ncbi:neuronal PAS domain protein [Thalictrum thalictroides]|uniref:Neuronal PAS domain protein n=1 Tax=Thalictrum thalictroides TaxID=46969 RepID=A0A7J6X4R7_THATH|nr:neuronal PAS domain protein [Thalictrum thalictroides]
MDIWSWMCELPNSADWPDSNSPFTFQLTSSQQDEKSILLKAERTSGSNTETLVTFSICLQGFNSQYKTTLWVSDTCLLSSNKPFLPLLMQLLQEIISRSPIAYDSTCPRSQFPKLKPEPISWIIDTHSPESFSSFFNLVLLCRLFWLCVCDSHFEVGELYFNTLLAPNFNLLSCGHVVRNFLISMGVDAELCFMRTIGYMVAKWLMLRNMGVGLQLLTPLQSFGFSYAMESHGFWILKGFAPILSMTQTRFDNKLGQGRVLEAKESVLRYVLAHQQLEAVIQLEYSVGFYDNFIQVNVRVENLRFHVVKLGFNKNDDGEYTDETYFPSRIRVWVGPEVGATYVAGLSLSRSTENPDKEMENQKVVKGNFGKTKASMLKAKTRTSARTRTRNWRWEQDVDGNAVIFEAILHDDVNGLEVATWKPRSGGNPKIGLKNRYTGGSRVFNKTGGLVLAGDEYGEWVSWRVSKEMEGSVLKWRLGGKVWLSYFPNDVKSNYFETRCVDWCQEVDLPLILGKQI